MTNASSHAGLRGIKERPPAWLRQQLLERSGQESATPRKNGRLPRIGLLGNLPPSLIREKRNSRNIRKHHHRPFDYENGATPCTVCWRVRRGIAGFVLRALAIGIAV